MFDLQVQADCVPDYTPYWADVDKKNPGNTTVYKQLHITCDPDAFLLLSTIRYDPLVVKKSPLTPDELTSEMFFLWDLHMRRLRFTLRFFSHFVSSKPDEEYKKHDTGGRLVEATEGAQDAPSADFPRWKVDDALILSQIRDAFVCGGVLTENPLKVRLLVKLSGHVRIELHETPVRPDLYIGLTNSLPVNAMYDVYVDRTPVFASPFTSFKTTNRTVYDEARKRALPGKSSLEEVILINTAKQVMEGSIFNLAVELSDGTFVTPGLRSGCHCGVTRYALLAAGLIRESTIMVDELLLGHEILMFNAIVGVIRGVIRGFVEPEKRDWHHKVE